MKLKMKIASILLLVLMIGMLITYYIGKKPTKPSKLTLREVHYKELPGWESADPRQSLLAFQQSCSVFLKQDPERRVGSDFIHMRAKDWRPVCQEATKLNANDIVAIKQFFETHFVPFEFYKNEPVKGLFTGYYMPLLQGRLKKNDQFNVPIYGVPKNLVMVNLQRFDKRLKHPPLVGRVQGHHLIPYYTRAEINHGAINKLAPVVVWLDNLIERSFMEIQGSGMIALPDGQTLFVNYAAENGAPYTSVAKVLIDKGIMTRDNASMQHIRRYLEQHPKQMKAVLNKNKSFVFFNVVAQNAALGAQGVALTPGYSMAVDRKWVPLGVPMWLSTQRPHMNTEQQKDFQRLMVAQDTGGAIKGTVRGDVYWGAGKKATKIAGRMKNPGHYWMLLPQSIVSRLHYIPASS